jgi:hypothetical protein
MAKKETKATRIAAAKKATTAEKNAALDAAATEMATAPDPITGQALAQTDSAPTRKAVKAALEEQFNEADEAGEVRLRQAALGGL